LTLHIIGKAPARPGNETSDISIDLSLAGLHEGIKDASQKTVLVRNGIGAGASLVSEGREAIPGMCCVWHFPSPVFQGKLNVPHALLGMLCLNLWLHKRSLLSQ
jgi:hypothetical protein